MTNRPGTNIISMRCPQRTEPDTFPSATERSQRSLGPRYLRLRHGVIEPTEEFCLPDTAPVVHNPVKDTA